MGCILFTHTFPKHKEIELIRILEGIRINYGISYEIYFIEKKVVIQGGDEIIEKISASLASSSNISFL